MWTKENTEGVTTLIKMMDHSRVAKLEVMVMSLFSNLKMVELCSELPNTFPELTEEQTAKLTQLALNIENLNR